MNQNALQKAFVWCGMSNFILFILAFVSAGFIPPLAPAMTVQEVALHYQEHATGIRVGMGLMLFSAALYVALVAVISGQMLRIPGISPTLIYGQTVGGGLATTAFLFPAMFFLITSYRPERAADITYTLNDLSWIVAVIPWPPFMIQMFSFALAVLSDQREKPLFPRWLAYLNIWVPISFIPGIVLPFFKDGPFAWDGIFVFWLPGGLLGIWFIAMTKSLLQSIDSE